MNSSQLIVYFLSTLLRYAYPLQLLLPSAHGAQTTARLVVDWDHNVYRKTICVRIMFSSKEQLEKRTPREQIDRSEYIGLLADEYYESTDLGNVRPTYYNLNFQYLIQYFYLFYTQNAKYR